MPPLARLVAQPPMLTRVNRAAILEFVRDHGPVSRSELARQLRLSPPTVGRLVRQLIDQGLVRERELGASVGGRRPVLLEHDPRAAALIGVDIGERGAVLAVADLDGRLLHQRHVALPADGADASVGVLVAAISGLIDAARAEGLPVRGTGLGVPGVTDAGAGIARWVPSLGWRDLPLQRIVEERTGLPAGIDNNVNLGALGEQWRGAGQGLRNIVYLFIGTGIGAGVVVNGQLYRGAHHAAGEVGHFMLDRSALGRRYPGFGFFESLAAGPGILRAAGDATGRTWDSVEGVTAAAASDPEARALADEALDWIALAVGNIACLIDPEAIVLGGDVARAVPSLAAEIAARLDGRIPVSPRISLSRLGAQAGVIGAVALAAQRTNGYLSMTEQ